MVQPIPYFVHGIMSRCIFLTGRGAVWKAGRQIADFLTYHVMK